MAVSTIQKVTNFARETFKTLVTDKTLITDNLQVLKSLCNEIKASDLNITAGVTQEFYSRPARPGDPKPPVSYMSVYEDNVLSMGVFFLRGGSRIPLHDHPGMYGLCRVIYGTINVQSFSHIEDALSHLDIPEFDEFRDISRPEKRILKPTNQHLTENFTSDTDTCLLLPKIGNYHELKAVNGPAAFLDILAPPYAPELDRDCMYYKLLTAKTGDIKWLLEIDPPVDFWTDEIPYTGPKIV